VAPLLDGVSAVAVVGDDLVATRAVALGIGRRQALRRQVYVADLSGEEVQLAPDGDRPGVSDMIRYGISLGRVAQAQADVPNLHTIESGIESPLAEDVLSSARWSSLNEQLHRAGSLLLLAVPSRVPGMERLLRQLDGALLVGEAAPPGREVRLLGEVRTAATMRTPARATRAIGARTRSRRRPLWPMLAAAAGLVLAVLAIPQVRQYVPGLGRSMPATPADSALDASASSSLPPVAPRVTSDAAWSTELLFTNSSQDALARSQEFSASLPAATFSDLPTDSDSATWYRVITGAFPDSISAENFLALLRNRGVIPATGGGVVHTPFALLVDSTLEPEGAKLRVGSYYARGLPAYTLRDAQGWWRIYVGAYSQGAEAQRQRQRLDSLNIQSTLVVRVGSTS
jgi:hypothetical protein